jgi:lysophospholipid acyltransferase (LPLAT)-like uncharacterized protein
MEEESKSAREMASPTQHFDAEQPRYSLWRRMQIRAIAGGVISVVQTIGPTLRYEVLGWQHAERAHAAGRQCIWVFWHQAILGIVYWGRGRGIVILNSTNFDGQWAERVIKHFGYGTAHGSSTRGAITGFNELMDQMKEGHDVGLTIDGPRGPRFVAKKGPVMLAKLSGQAIIPFHVAFEHGKTLEKTWDKFRVPRPFTRVFMAAATPIQVPKDADFAMMEAKQLEMQASLENTQKFCDGWFQLSPAEQDREREKWNA